MSERAQALERHRSVSMPAVLGLDEISGRSHFEVLDKYTGDCIATVGQADAAITSQAVAAADQAFKSNSLTAHGRADLLAGAARLLSERVPLFVETIIAESGQTRAEAEDEVRRAVTTLTLCSEEAQRLAGRMVPVDGARNQQHRFGFTIRVPVGVVCAITPFNSPLNTVLHKVGPALAAGNAVVLKPSPYTPLSAHHLWKLFQDVGLPKGLLNVVCGDGAETGEALLRDERIRFYSFTGSTAVGRRIHEVIGPRRAQLELGAISCSIVGSDYPLEAAAQRLVPAAFRKAGQVCTSVQVVLVDRERQRDFEGVIAALAATYRAGDPRDPSVRIGPMISQEAAARAERSVQDAIARDARALTPVRRSNAVMGPVVLTDVDWSMGVAAQEIFAPVVSIIGYDSFEGALEQVARLPYGLSAGVFTNSWQCALRAARRLPVGVVQINDSSSSRVDLMPFGGQNASGYGREGPAYAIQEVTDERLVLFNGTTGFPWGAAQ